jgi:hypothetical protein
MFVKICWFITLAGCGIGGLLALDMLLATDASAPQQGAAAAMACAFAVIPYVFTRAIEGMRGPQK